MRYSNSDPITGQAAWFDLRVKIERIALPAKVENGQSLPDFAPLQDPYSMGVK